MKSSRWLSHIWRLFQWKNNLLRKYDSFSRASLYQIFIFSIYILHVTYYNATFVTEYLTSGIFCLETNSKRLVFSISRSFSSRSPFCCSFLPLDTVMQRTAGSTNPRWRDTTMSGIYYLNPLSNDPRLFFFVYTAIWARSWLSFFPISLARRHHVVTDDVPLRCPFFCDGRLSRVTLVSPRPNECMLYASVLSLRVRYHYLSKGNDKKTLNTI